MKDNVELVTASYILKFLIKNYYKEYQIEELITEVKKDIGKDINRTVAYKVIKEGVKSGQMRKINNTYSINEEYWKIKNFNLSEPNVQNFFMASIDLILKGRFKKSMKPINEQTEKFGYILECATKILPINKIKIIHSDDNVKYSKMEFEILNYMTSSQGILSRHSTRMEIKNAMIKYFNKNRIRNERFGEAINKLLNKKDIIYDGKFYRVNLGNATVINIVEEIVKIPIVGNIFDNNIRNLITKGKKPNDIILQAVKQTIAGAMKEDETNIKNQLIIRKMYQIFNNLDEDKKKLFRECVDKI